MKAIVAVYDDWGIGAGGTQPVALSADRKFFRETTRGSAVIVGRKTLGDFPGGRPLPGRTNFVLTRGDSEVPGAVMCCSPEEAVEKAAAFDSAFVIGGGTIYSQMLPFCDAVYVTKVHAKPESDTYFHNLDEDSAWYPAETLQQGTENGIDYEMILYRRK